MKHRMLSPLAIALVLGLGTVGAHAQSSEEQAACRSDAMKYCSSSIGKPDQMKPCLAKNKSQLSEACKKIVEARGG